ncbi:hypothetical protein AMTR_s00062p00211040, partial [Amborella trichopoda]
SGKGRFWKFICMTMDCNIVEEEQLADLSWRPSGLEPTIMNVVAVLNLDCKLDLKAIAMLSTIPSILQHVSCEYESQKPHH